MKCWFPSFQLNNSFNNIIILNGHQFTSKTKSVERPACIGTSPLCDVMVEIASGINCDGHTCLLEYEQTGQRHAFFL